MNATSKRDVFFSFFMFTADLRPQDSRYTQILIDHLKALTDMGYDGFDVHIASQPATVDHQLEVESYVGLKKAFDKAGLKEAKFTTNVGTTRTFDPTSPYEEQRRQALSYLKSRVDITRVLGGDSIMSGPFLYPYGVFPVTDANEPIWSDALQDWMKPRYHAARSVFEDLVAYAAAQEVKLAIEPVKSWETPPPNMVSEVLDFLDGLENSPCGVTIDTAQVVMESQGPQSSRTMSPGPYGRIGSTMSIYLHPTGVRCKIAGSRGTSSWRDRAGLSRAVPDRGVQRDPAVRQLYADGAPALLAARRGRPSAQRRQRLRRRHGCVAGTARAGHSFRPSSIRPIPPDRHPRRRCLMGASHMSPLHQEGPEC